MNRTRGGTIRQAHGILRAPTC